MQKNGFTIIEVVVVFLLVLGVTFFVLPLSLDNTKQARFISKWTESYSKLEYMFSAIKAQKDSNIQAKFDKAQNNNDRREIVLETIKPYLRITSEAKPDYKQYFMNGLAVGEGGRYFVKNHYRTNSNEIVGIKWIKAKCENNEVCGVLTYDVNGTKPPNTWGYDVFGLNILKDRIEPFGKNIDTEVLRDDCSRHGLGVYCSYYYLIGGKFD